MLALEYAEGLPAAVRGGVVVREQPVGNPNGFSLWPAGTHSPRETALARQIVAARLGQRVSAFRFLRQVHGTTVVFRDEDDATIPAADAHWTDRRGIVLTANVADCCPVVVADREGRAVGLAHSGWRGTAGTVSIRLVEAILTDGPVDSAAELTAWVGPCAEVDRYEVGADVGERFQSFPDAVRPHPEDAGKRLLDVRRAITTQLIAAGIPETAISVSPGGTIGDRRYHSHRRDGFAAGRMLAYAYLAP